MSFLLEAAARLERPIPRLGERYARPGDLYRVLEPTAIETPATRLIDDHLVAMRDGDVDRLIITVPPQQGKSERCSRTLPLWLLLDDPSRRIVLASYEKEIAVRWGRRVRTDVLTHNGDEGTIDLGLRVRTDTWAADRWQLDGHAGSMTTVGVGSALTGRPADVLGVDDPMRDRQQANSKVYRDRVWDWWTSTARTRLAPGAPAYLVLTRWHEDDLAGRLLEEAGDRWVLLNIPAQSEGEGDPLGRPEGAYLISTRGTTVEQWEETKRDVGPMDWASLYQGHPTPAAGGLFKRKHFRYWQATSDPWTIQIPGRPGPDEDIRAAFRFITVDLAASTRTSADWTVAAAWAVAGTGELLLLDLARAQVNPEDHWGEVVGPLSARWNAKIFVEGSQYGTDLVYTAARKGAQVEAVHADRDKYSRAVPAATRMSQGMILLPPPTYWLPEFEAECVIESTMIVTRQGLVRAKDILVGDEVLTHRGRFRKVTGLSNRMPESLITIRGKTLDPITLTPDHRVYAMTVHPNSVGCLAPRGTGWMAAGDLRQRQTRLTSRGQIEPSLRPHHALTVPVLSPDAITSEIDLRAFFDLSLPAPKTSGKGRRQWNIIDDGDTIRLNVGRANPLRYRQKLTYQFGRVCGLYLAEGSYSHPGRAQWSFHREETQYQAEVHDYLKDEWGVASHASKPTPSNPNCIVVTASFTRLAAFFETFGHGAANKRIPWWAWDAPDDFIEGLVSGWFDGDGCRNADRDGWTGGTVSPHLAWGIRLLATRLHRWCLLSYSDPAAPSYIKGVLATPRHGVWTVDMKDKEGASTHVFDGENIGLWVKESKPAPVERVYNFSVDEDESYVTTGGAVHNCLSFPQSAHDDQVDVLSYAHRVVGEFWVPPPSTSPRPSQPPTVIREAFGGGGADIASTPL